MTLSGSTNYGILLNWCHDIYVKDNTISNSDIADLGILGLKGKSIEMPASRIHINSNTFESQNQIIKELAIDVVIK